MSPPGPGPAGSVLIRGALVADGTGGTPYPADVRVTAGRIAEITGPGAARSGADGRGGRHSRVLEADGLVLAPGFIDMHAHSDLALLRDPDHSAKLAQGVTLEVLGQDGLSYAPADERALPGIRQAVAGWNGDDGAPGAARETAGGADSGTGTEIGWRTVGAYLDRLDRGVAVNAAYLVPQGTVRAVVCGWEDRPATAAETGTMRRMVAEGLADGAVGMSSGLTYPPGMYASDAELVTLCREVARYGGYYCPHHRSYGAGALQAYAAMLAVARESGCALHLAHATLNFGVNAGRAGELLALLDEALAAGAEVSLDTYPYLAGSTTLAALLPGWAHAGGPGALLERLRDDATAARIRHDLEVAGSDGCHGVPVDWTTIEISGVRDPALADRVGNRPSGFAEARELLLADRLGTTILQHVGHEENVRAIMRHRAHTAGSDGILTGAKPHPRAYGTFPAYLGRYVRELGVFTLQECVAHLTGRAARRLRLPDRGLVREGYRADLVLFDPESIAPGASPDRPRALPVGIPYVLVNGQIAIDDGRRTAVVAGRSVRRTPV